MLRATEIGVPIGSFQAAEHRLADEHDMHPHVKRALASKSRSGTAEVHRQRVADRIGLVPASR